MRRALAMLLAAPLLGGCYDVGEGDVVVFRVAVEEQVVASGCFTEDAPEPLEDQLSSSSYLTPVTWVVYYGAGDKVLLDANGVSIGGEENSDGFVFTGHTVDVEYEGTNNSEAKVTITTETTVRIDQSGDAVSGEILDVVSTSCDFLTATPSPGLCSAIDDCERRSAFSGVMLDDVELDETINRDNPI